MRPLYIFDLDGTLSLTEHRQSILDNKSNPRRWQEFFAACVDDKPNKPVISTMHKLIHGGADILIMSGRSDEVYQETVVWLIDNTGLYPKAIDSRLLMREEGDHTPDDDLKRSWLHKMRKVDRDRLVAVFDDRDKVVKMWRSEGIPCFQVAQGDF